jgi:HSP20 family molecular chaperone IbpA
MDRIFHSFFDEDTGLNTNLPRVDVREEENSYVLEAELPGTTEKDIDVKVENDLLQISTEKEEEKEEKNKGYLMREIRSASYHRSFVLPKDTDREKIEANFKNGLLTLTIPKTEVVKPRQIEVKNA